eukprot:scaffold12180_cov17-Tisochrysis_lutea.AAC.1
MSVCMQLQWWELQCLAHFRRAKGLICGGFRRAMSYDLQDCHGVDCSGLRHEQGLPLCENNL